MDDLFTLEITLGNAAMKSLEDVARALEDVQRLIAGVDSGKILDVNGNSVGGFGLIEQDDSL